MFTLLITDETAVKMTRFSVYVESGNRARLLHNAFASRNAALRALHSPPHRRADRIGRLALVTQY
jgi:hypothetical protein